MELDFTNDVIEKLLFKKALTDKNWLNIVTNAVDPNWISTKYIGSLLEMLSKYYSKYESSPSLNIVQAMVKKHNERHPSEDFNMGEVNELLAEIQVVGNGMPEDAVNSNLKEYIRRKALSASLYESLDVLDNAEKDSDRYQKVIDKCLEKFDKVQKITFNDTDLGMDYFDEKAMAEHWEFLRNPDAKIKTGWESVDRYTNGGFLKCGRMLALFMAQAGLGKSVFLSNLAVNILKQNLSVVVISLEMSQDVYAQRFDSHISKKNINRLRENEQAAVDRIKRFYQAYPNAHLYIKEYPPRSVNSKTIEQYLDNLKTSGKRFDVLIVDYLNLVLPNRPSDSMFRDGMSVSEELRSLSYKFNVPVISAVQSNSEGMNNADIDMQNVSESRGIVHTADALFALFQKPEDRENGKLGFKIIKNRLGGRVGSHSTFKMDPETLIVADVTGDNGISCNDNANSPTGRLTHDLPDIEADVSSL